MNEPVTLTGGSYRLVDLADANGLIQNLSATNVTFRGPAVIIFDQGLKLSDPTAYGTVDALLWEIEEHRDVVAGAIKFVNSELIGCKFLSIGFAGKPETISNLLQAAWVAGEPSPQTPQGAIDLASQFEIRDGETFIKDIKKGTPGPGALGLRMDPITGQVKYVVPPGGPEMIDGVETTELPANMHVDDNGKVFRIPDPGEEPKA